MQYRIDSMPKEAAYAQHDGSAQTPLQPMRPRDHPSSEEVFCGDFFHRHCRDDRKAKRTVLAPDYKLSVFCGSQL